MRTGFLQLLCAIALCWAHIACAQYYPVKPIRMYTPYPPGGTTDMLACIFGATMHEAWGQPLAVEAKPGAGGNIGADFVAKRPRTAGQVPRASARGCDAGFKLAVVKQANVSLD